MPPIRVINIPSIYAENALTTIPNPPVAGAFYRNETFTNWEDGQAYKLFANSADWNQLLYNMSFLMQQVDQFGILPYSPVTDYPVSAYAQGIDNKLYVSLAANGPATTPVEPGTDPAVWVEFSAGDENPLVYPSAFGTFYEQTPPTGWAVRDGSLISNADTAVPKLLEALQLPANAWKLKTEAEWQAMSTAVPFSGIGGVPFFVLDEVANTIRLPDTRGMYEEGAGFDGLNVGGVHGDMIRDFSLGFVNRQLNTQSSGVIGPIAGSVDIVNQGGATVSVTGAVANAQIVTFAPSFSVPVGNANKPRGYGVLHCVYTG